MVAPSLRESLIRLAHAHPEFRQKLLPLVKRETVRVRTAASVARLSRDVALKDGTFVPRGSAVAVEFPDDRPSLCLLGVEGRDAPVKVSTVHLHAYLAGYQMPPSRAKLAEWLAHGTSETVTGKVVEVDGWGPDGSPSWLLVLGMV